MGTKTLLNGVNAVLRRVNILTGDTGELDSLTSSPRQVFIDTAIQVWNEATIQLYSSTSGALPTSITEATITLVNGDRDYALASDLVRIYWPLQDETNGREIEQYPGGYMQMVNDQEIPTNYTGIPYYGVIRPTDGLLYLDAIPQAAEAGLVYKYRYDKSLVLDTATDTFPFSDQVFQAMVPAVTELWRRSRNRMVDNATLEAAMGTASRMLSENKMRPSWFSDWQVRSNPSDPYSRY